MKVRQLLEQSGGRVNTVTIDYQQDYNNQGHHDVRSLSVTCNVIKRNDPHSTGAVSSARYEVTPTSIVDKNTGQRLEFDQLTQQDWEGIDAEAQSKADEC